MSDLIIRQSVELDRHRRSSFRPSSPLVLPSDPVVIVFTKSMDAVRGRLSAVVLLLLLIGLKLYGIF